MKSWRWEPGVSVGELRFGAVLMPGSYDFYIERLPRSCDDADWETYRIEDELGRISVMDERIESVECVKSLRFGDTELIGRCIGDINHVLPEPAVLREVYDSGEERWESDALGLMLWVENDVVASATVSAADHDGVA